MEITALYRVVCSIVTDNGPFHNWHSTTFTNEASAKRYGERLYDVHSHVMRVRLIRVPVETLDEFEGLTDAVCEENATTVATYSGGGWSLVNESVSQKLAGKPLYQILMDRDGNTREQAELRIDECRARINEAAAQGVTDVDAILAEELQLEPDYLWDIV